MGLSPKMQEMAKCEIGIKKQKTIVTQWRVLHIESNYTKKLRREMINMEGSITRFK